MQEVLIFKGADRAKAVSVFAKKWLLLHSSVDLDVYVYAYTHWYNERNCWPPLSDKEVLSITNKAQTDYDSYTNAARREGRLKWEGNSLVVVDRKDKKTRKDGTI